MTYETNIESPPSRVIDYVKSKMGKRRATIEEIGVSRVKYRSFKVEENFITIDKYSSLLNPLNGFGTITFELSETEGMSKVKVSIDTYSRYAYAFMFIVFFMLNIPILFLCRYIMLKMSLFLSVFWVGAFGFAYLFMIVNRNRLEQYSRIIIDDFNRIDK